MEEAEGKIAEMPGTRDAVLHAPGHVVVEYEKARFRCVVAEVSELVRWRYED